MTMIGAQSGAGGAGDHLGAAVAGLGDVNGDGNDDFAVTSPLATNPYPAQVHVVRGGALPARLDMRDSAAYGWSVVNQDHSVGRVSGAGDFNGDGLGDLAVAEPFVELRGRVSVVFGQSGSTPADLDALGSRGLRIEGHVAFDGPRGRPRESMLGVALDEAGDFNADGFADIVAGAPGMHGLPGREYGAGAAYVIYGGTSTEPVEIAALGSRGLEMRGVPSTPDAHGPGRVLELGRAAAGGFDLNSDGHPDVAIGAPITETGAGTRDGRVYVLFGKSTPGSFSTTDVPPSVLRIETTGRDAAGSALAGPGDLSADGRDELLVGTYATPPDGDPSDGVIYAAEALPVRLGAPKVRTGKTRIPVPLRCAAYESSCDGRLSVKVRERRGGALRQTVVASGTFKLRAGQRKSVRLGLSKRGRRLIGARARRRALVTIRSAGVRRDDDLIILRARPTHAR